MYNLSNADLLATALVDVDDAIATIANDGKAQNGAIASVALFGTGIVRVTLRVGKTVSGAEAMPWALVHDNAGAMGEPLGWAIAYVNVSDAIKEFRFTAQPNAGGDFELTDPPRFSFGIWQLRAG